MIIRTVRVPHYFTHLFKGLYVYSTAVSKAPEMTERAWCQGGFVDANFIQQKSLYVSSACDATSRKLQGFERDRSV
jgi:hypothetical protein